jgi:predicted alpha-1,6-mannanase (GH76 family)
MTDPDFHVCAAAGAGTLQRWYDQSTGLWTSTGWWNAANALTAVIGYSKLTGDSSHDGCLAATFTAAQRQHAGFINDYYDDNGWWALAWVAAFDMTLDSRYLDAARTIFTHNTGGWDDTCGGGLWWNTSRNYKNAITNELFLTLATLLHQRTTGDSSYLSWAQREWEWFQASGLIGPSGLVNDGLTSACANNGGTTWTYNQGVVLGGLAALFEVTGDRSYLQQGQVIANAVLDKLVTPASAHPPGILIEPCEQASSGCNGDQTQFKGILIRYLYEFWLQSRQPAYRTFILANARSVWDNNTNTSHQFGLRWTGPFDQADAARQSSALEALNAAVALAD